jgi:hypothetical protein
MICRYMLGCSKDVLHVCFMGTKGLKDYIVDASLTQKTLQLWERESQDKTESVQTRGRTGCVSPGREAFVVIFAANNTTQERLKLGFPVVSLLQQQQQQQQQEELQQCR